MYTLSYDAGVEINGKRTVAFTTKSHPIMIIILTNQTTIKTGWSPALETSPSCTN